MITILIPAYNEQATIGELLRHVTEAPYEKQIVVVDDASTDATPEILAAWNCQTIRHPHNRGKGAAIRTGLAYAQGEFTIVQDADLEYDPNDYPQLIEPLLQGADAVYGSRYLERNHTGTWANRAGVSALNVAVRLLYGARLTDEATCYKAFPTATLQAMDLECERFEFCLEVTATALRMGLRITEVPIRYQARSVAEGKKIRWRDGVEALQTLWCWRNWRPSGSCSRLAGTHSTRARQRRQAAQKAQPHVSPYRCESRTASRSSCPLRSASSKLGLAPSAMWE